MYRKHQLFYTLDEKCGYMVTRLSQALNGLIDFPFFYGFFDQKQLLFRVTDYYPVDLSFSKKNVSYPPYDKANLNRCNFQNQPVFYAANNSYGALLETSAAFSGENCNVEIKYIGVWEVVKPFAMIDFYYKTITESTNPMLRERIEKRKKMIYNTFAEPLEMERVLRFCGDRFAIEGDKAYSFTSLISNLLYKQIIENNYISGISYVGAKTDNYFKRNIEAYSNVALTTDLILNESIVLKDVIKLEISGFKDDELNILSATEESEIIQDRINLIEFESLTIQRQKEILAMLSKKNR
jgi:hypothetical protein